MWSALALLPPVHACAERSCDTVVEAIRAVFDAPLSCMRHNCPDFSLLDSGTPEAERCAGECNLAWNRPPPTGPADEVKRCEHLIPRDEKVAPDYYQLALCLAASESDLSRCAARFRTPDQRDYFKLARCVRASEAMALVVTPLHTCLNRDECLKDSRNRLEGPCFDQCRHDAEQIVELAATTVERCDGIEQSKGSLCSLLRQTMNVCFLPKHCDRLSRILQKSCM